MKKNTKKSSLTLPLEEFQLIQRLKKDLHLKTNVAVIRRSLRLLEETENRQRLRTLYREASQRINAVTADEYSELDALSSEGVE